MVTVSPHKIFLIEDHDLALKIWRKIGVKNLDLIHLDAHIDFSLPAALPIQKIFKEASCLKELKESLEKTLTYLKYENDFDKQTNIGNFVYPAIVEGKVRNFYWIVPGGEKEFRKSAKFLTQTLKSFLADRKQRIEYARNSGLISTEILGRNFIICALERLPILKQKTLLDIDTDFLVIDSAINADNTKNIGKRKPWILPRELIDKVKNKVRHPEVITIAYSVNGGFTPMKYKYLGDEVAYYFLPKRFKRHFEKSSKAAQYFNLFLTSGNKDCYQKAARLNPAYQTTDNNYGPLYLALRKFSLAKKEFLRILKVDPKNPACLLGLGNIALERKYFKKAKKYFSSVLNSENHRLFREVKNQSLIALAQAEYGLNNFANAKKLLIRYKDIKPLNPQGYYLLGCIMEEEKDFQNSARFYQDAIRLGMLSIEPISKLFKISSHLLGKDAIIKYVIVKLKDLKKRFLRTKKLSHNTGKKILGAVLTEKRIIKLEKELLRINCKGRNQTNE